jgi:hypothetical protein
MDKLGLYVTDIVDNFHLSYTLLQIESRLVNI